MPAPLSSAFRRLSFPFQVNHFGLFSAPRRLSGTTVSMPTYLSLCKNFLLFSLSFFQPTPTPHSHHTYPRLASLTKERPILAMAGSKVLPNIAQSIAGLWFWDAQSPSTVSESGSAVPNEARLGSDHWSHGHRECRCDVAISEVRMEDGGNSEDRPLLSSPCIQSVKPQL